MEEGVCVRKFSDPFDRLVSGRVSLVVFFFFFFLWGERNFFNCCALLLCILDVHRGLLYRRCDSLFLISA